MILFIILFILVLFLTKNIAIPERVAWCVVYTVAYFIYSMLLSGSIGYTNICTPIFLNKIQFISQDPRNILIDYSLIDYNLSEDIKNRKTIISDYKLTYDNSAVVVRIKDKQEWYFINVNPRSQLSFLINKEEFKTLIQ